MAKASVPGKIHIIGEHAVVYGKPAILAAVNQRCTVEVKKRDDGIIRVEIEGHFKLEFTVTEAMKFLDQCSQLWKKGQEKNDWSELNKLLKEVPQGQRLIVARSMEALKIKTGMDIKVTSDIMKKGMGSSAALAVAFPAAMAKEFLGRDIGKERINEIAFSIEKYLHGGTPSGGDNTTCCYGGLILFQKGASPRNLSAEIPHRLSGFMIAYAEPEKSTGELVQQVRDLEPGFRDQRVEDLGKLTELMLGVLKFKDWGRMKDIINLSHKNLRELGVSTARIDRLVEAVKKAGGAAKLCGAGGGGAILCWHENRERLSEAIKSAGFEPFDIELGAEGVMVEN